ncbi:MAG: AI-2E family transporter [Rubrivivax sp.]
MIIFFVAFFLLAGGPALAGRFIDLWGPEPARRARAARALAECARQVRLYAWVLLAANAAIGLVVWALFSATGLPDAAGWGVAASVLHLVPYLGMAALTALGAAEAFIAHGTLAAAAGIAAAVVVVSVLIGTIGTAVMQGRAARMSPAAVFIGLVFWGALWGLWGMFLGPALIVALKVVAENMASGQRLARVLQG